MKRTSFLLLLPVLLVQALAACSDDPKNFQNILWPDMALPDQKLPDRALTDKAVTDQELADQAVTDKALSDKAVTDQELADQAVADQKVPDQTVTDQEVPDQAVTDQKAADQTVPDQTAASDLSVPDQTPPDAGTDTAAPDLLVYLDGAGPDAGPSCKLKVQKTLSFVNGTASAAGKILSTDTVSQVTMTASGCTNQATPGADHLYAITLKASTKYRVHLAHDTGYDAAFHVFTDCDKPQGTCALGQDSNTHSKGLEVSDFTTTKAGAYYIGVDSKYQPAGSSYGHGTYTLTVSDLSPPVHNTCGKAQSLTFVGSKATASYTTGLAAANMDLTSSGCTGKSTQGPDLFYSLSLGGNKYYKVSLTPAAGYDASLYVLSKCDKSACVAGADDGGAGEAEVLVFKPTTTGTYLFGVDSKALGNLSASRGKFTLTVETFYPLYGELCSKPLPLGFFPSWTKAKTSGNTSTGVDTLSIGGISYGGTTAPSTPGRDQFFALPVAKDMYYAVIVKSLSSFSPLSYALSSCANPATNFLGWGSSAGSAKAGSFAFKAAAKGVAVLGVDSTSAGQHGAFTLAFWQGSLAANDTCATAKAITLVNGKATITGSKFAATNTLPKCGTSAAGASDLFYKFKPVQGKKYKLTFKPKNNNGHLGVWDGAHACNPAKVAAACGSAGGFTFVLNGASSARTFKSTSGDIYLVVDGVDAFTDVYDFTIDIEEVP